MVAELLMHFSIFATPDRGSTVTRMRPMTSPHLHFRYFSPTGEMQEAEGKKKEGRRKTEKTKKKIKDHAQQSDKDNTCNF